MRTEARPQRGQALVEALVAMIALVPLMLLVVLLGKFQSMQQATIAASRTLAFECTVRPGDCSDAPARAMLAEDARRRHFGRIDREIFTADKPIIFAYHGYPWTIHRLTYRRTNHANFHVRGFNEEGTTTTPFDMTVMNGLDRYQLVQSVIDRTPAAHASGASLKLIMQQKLLQHHDYIRAHGQDMPEVRDWKWIAQ
jgi:xylulose-5-phosphate/fructose-6-phosphate phosphoketolase